MIKKIFKLLLFCLSTIILIISALLIYYFILLHKEKLINKKRKIEANIVLTGDKLAECINGSCPSISCKTQDDWKAAFYKAFGKKTACATALYKAKHLKNIVPYPRHHKCYHRLDTEFFKQEGLDYKELKSKYLTGTKLPKIKSSTDFKIPPKLNFVWFTSEKEFKLDKDRLFKINTYLFHNAKITPNWQHTVWTNNTNWITDIAKKRLKAQKIQLRSIDEINMTNPKHKALRILSKKYAYQHRWGLASDIARDLVEYYEGGIYVDGDYKILQPMELEKYMKSYKSFFGINSNNNSNTYRNFYEIINAFMASEPKGTIIEKKLDLVYRNTIDIISAPNYIKYPCNKYNATLFKTGPIILTIAFALKKKASDVLLPYCTLFESPQDFLTCFNTQKLGKHSFHGGWTKNYSAMTQQLIY